MAQKREKEVTELKLRPPTIPVPRPQFPTVRPSENSDPKLSEPVEGRNGSEKSPENSHLIPTNYRASSSLKRPREVCRCSGSGCRKRVGLMGFRCRCGNVFCSKHRYSDRHDCGYDYKAAGRETIARENPVVRAAKLLKV